MARLLLIAASAALLASTSTAAAVLVVRSSGPSAAAYPPGKALPDNHVLKLKATDTVILLDSRGTRTLNGPGSFSVAASAANTSAPAGATGTSARRVRLGAVRGTGGTRSVWQADLGRTGNVCIANPSELTLYRPEAAAAADVTLTDSDGKAAKVHFDANQWEASWPADISVKTGKRINVTGLAQPATLTLRQLSPIPSGLEGMAQSLIRADCQAQLDVLVDTYSARSEG